MNKPYFILATLVLALSVTVSVAQTTSFTYQGRFTDGGAAANGEYDMQFKLFDFASVGAGNQVGSTIALSSVPVTNGVFTVQLNLGAVAFPGADRFLEIGVRPAGSGDPYTVLSPRQMMSAAPYAIRAATAGLADNAVQLNGADASQYIKMSDARLSDSRSPLPGSNNYIQNTNSQQSANFNISGNGAAGGSLSAQIVNAATQYNINGKRVLIADGSNNTFLGFNSGVANIPAGQLNTFVGVYAGSANTSGSGNSFFGAFAGHNASTSSGNSFFGNQTGAQNTGNNNSFFGSGVGGLNKGQYNSFFGLNTGYLNDTGSNNAFFGTYAGGVNTTASDNSYFGFQAGKFSTGANNSFFGSNAGVANTTGFANAFFGMEAGDKNKDGFDNSFFGRGSGGANLGGSQNSFFGRDAGAASTSGDANVFLGRSAGAANVGGNNNTIVGSFADTASGNLSNAAAIGYAAQVSQSNSLVLGGIKGVGIANADTNVGIGTTAPGFRLTVKTPAGSYGLVHTDGSVTVGSFVGGSTGGGWFGTKSNHSLSFFTNNGGAAMTLETSGFLTLNNVDAGGSLQLCLSPSKHISFCSSSLRYKTAVKDFKGGLNVVNRLRPITFDWKQGGMHDLGFGAEDVAAVEPLLVTRNNKGEVEGVKYDRVAAVLVNAVKEQQEQIKRQQNEIASLKALVCQRHRRARVCK